MTLHDTPDRHDSDPHWTGGAPSFEPLAGDTSADVCVVGAGVAGLSVAYELALRGASVVLLDRGDVGSGETHRSTAHLSVALDDRYHHLEKLHGEGGTRLVAASHAAAIERIGRIAMAESIDCGFERVPGYLHVAPDDQVDVLQRELFAIRRAGLYDVELVEHGPLAGVAAYENGLGGPFHAFAAQAVCDTARYVAGLARALVRRRGRIFTGTQVMTVAGGSDAKVETLQGHAVTARHVVVATNTPVNNLLSLHAKQTAYRTYVVAADVAKGAIANALRLGHGLAASLRPPRYPPSDERHADRRRRRSSDGARGRSRRAMGAPQRVDALPLSGGRSPHRVLVGPGDAIDRWTRIHRSKPARRRERVGLDRRYGERHDLRRHRGDAAGPADHRCRSCRSRSSTIPAA